MPAQDLPVNKDTFFLAKKKGLLGRLGKSISTTPPEEKPARVENPFIKFKGKIIRNIETVGLGFEYDIDDTTRIKNNFGVRVGKVFHKNTTGKVLQNNLFFKTGDRLAPYLLADNERYLRDLVYIKDARILVEFAEGSTDSVDVIVLTKDVFSIGGSINISSKNKGRMELRDENFLGGGNRFLISSYYENPRSPNMGIGGELIKRNIGGSFIDFTAGYQDYRNAFSSDRNQETVFYTRLEKPLVTPYIPTTGALEYVYRRTRNVYHTDSVYRDSFKYINYTLDGWLGYSLDNRRSLYENKEVRVHRFVAVRGFRQFFQLIPTAYKAPYDPRFADFTGALASFNIFRQVFYKTGFIYGFGRNEDIPEGFSVAATAGYVEKENIKRPYTGIDLSLSNFKKKGLYINYTLRIGGYFYRSRFEDVDMLFNIEHFTRLRKINANWFNRVFINTGLTAQANPVLNAPLYINNSYGLPYFNNGVLKSDLRATVKIESVFYNTTKILGFRFAPFIFSDAILAKPTKMNLKHSDIFTAVGGGLRTRNENLVFGTVELRTYYFPRLNGDMNPWKIELNSNIRFRFRSSFISRPDFIIAN
ncbi:MAG: hypothetical protein JNM14_07130 [Ferruginibacter sp.]|nr:hypothetical protein [Ferruginibacter sp.]